MSLRPKPVKIVEQNVKQTETLVLIRIERETATLEKRYGFYMQTIKVSIVPDKRYEKWGLTRLSNGKIFIHNNLAWTYEINFTRDEDEELSAVEITRSKPKKISKNNFLKLYREGYPVFNRPDLREEIVFA